MLAKKQVTVSIGALSRATRIPVNTIRTWEKRYGFPQANRTDSGHRLYSPEVITHLRLVARALERGHRAGQVLSLDLDALRSLIGENERSVRISRDSNQVEEWLNAARSFDAQALVGSFQRCVAQSGLVQFVMDDVPVLIRSIGEAWEAKELEIEHEHFASECLRYFLANEWRPMAEGRGGRRVILATLAGESHSLGLHLVACLYAFHGYQIYFLGSSLPVANMVSASKDLDAHVLSLSISAFSDARTTQEQLDTLVDALPSGVKLHLGGAGIPDDFKRALCFGELRELYAFLEEGR